MNISFDHLCPLTVDTSQRPEEKQIQRMNSTFYFIRKIIFWFEGKVPKNPIVNYANPY